MDTLWNFGFLFLSALYTYCTNRAHKYANANRLGVSTLRIRALLSHYQSIDFTGN